MWWWVLLFAAIALAGLGMLIGYAVWLTHKAADVLSEVGAFAGVGAEVLDLLEQVRWPDRTGGGFRDSSAAIGYVGAGDADNIS